MRSFFYILCFVGLALCGCNSTGCLDNGSALPLAGFYSYSTLKAIAVDSLEIRGLGAPGDSILVKTSSSLNQVYLPFRPEAGEVKWVVAYRQKQLDFPQLQDTITFKYSTIEYFASEQCGAMYAYRLSGVGHTSHLIDSIGVTDSLITNVEMERIHIYFRTETAPE